MVYNFYQYMLIIYFIKGSGDEVKCSSCGIQIRNFQPGDSVAKLHKAASPECSFTK